MISDRALAMLCAVTEAHPSPAWVFAGPTFHATVTETLTETVIACEGSMSRPDWFADFDVIGPAMYMHPDLGRVHAGFDRTTDECLPEIIRLAGSARRPLILTGHSKAGAEAEILACKLGLAGITIDRLVTFGTPRWCLRGNADVATLLPATLGLSYRHFRDIVTQLPEPIGDLTWDHPATRPVIEIGTGTFRDMLDVPGMHHISVYIANLPEG